jgi:cytochrome c oxidase assembly protein subunit 11
MAGPPSERKPGSLQDANRRLAGRLLLLAGGSLAFGFALVPLYDTFCRVAGLNGKSFETGGLPATAATVGGEQQEQIDTTRIVTVEFTATVMPGLPWDIRPLETSVDVHPGQAHTARFLVRNQSNAASTAQAVPSISPSQAATQFHKIQCFCFSEQALAPREARELPVTFIVRPGLDADVRTVTLAYAFFKVDAPSPRTL